MNKEEMFLVLGIGEVIILDDGILVIGFGGNFVLFVVRVMKNFGDKEMLVKEIVKNVLNIVVDICVFMNYNIIVEEL